MLLVEKTPPNKFFDAPHLFWDLDISGNWQTSKNVFNDSYELMLNPQRDFLYCLEDQFKLLTNTFEELTKLSDERKELISRLSLVYSNNRLFLGLNNTVPLQSDHIDFEERFLAASRRISDLCSSEHDFDFPPTENAFKMAVDALELLRQNKLLPSLINATNDHSLLFEFFIKNQKYSLNFYNSGEIVYLAKRHNEKVVVIEIDESELEEAISEMILAYGE